MQLAEIESVIIKNTYICWVKQMEILSLACWSKKLLHHRLTVVLASLARNWNNYYRNNNCTTYLQSI